jgi:predicted O-methyltransferase YrrM
MRRAQQLWRRFVELERFRTFARGEARELPLPELVGRIALPSETGPPAAIFAWQRPREILELLEELEVLRPRVVVEIGTGAGGTLLLLARVAAPDALLVSIDLRGGGFGGGYSRWRSRIYRSFARPPQRLELIDGDSHAVPTRQRLLQKLGGRKIDCLFIDGDHSYAGARQDFEDYSPLVAPGGRICLHDIREHPDGYSGEVWRLWKELELAQPGARSILEPGVAGYGLGIISLPD